MNEVPRVVRKAIAAFSADRLLRLPWAEMVAFLVSAEEALIPDAENEDTVTYWLARAEEAYYETGDTALTRQLCQQAADVLYELQELSLTRFSEAFGATSLFKLHAALFATDEQPFEDALKHMRDFVKVFEAPRPSVEEIKRGVKPQGITLAFDPIAIAREARELALQQDREGARRYLHMINRGLADFVDAAFDRNWRPPYPFGAILSR